MKRNYLIALTLFAAFLLCTRFQLWAELTLQQAEKAVEDADGKLGNANTHLEFPHTEKNSTAITYSPPPPPGTPPLWQH